MASIVGIVNSALIKVGAKKLIGSLDEGTPGANFGAARYEEIRDELLRGHPWNFAVARAKLARLSTTPNHKWEYEYSVPSDWLRTMWISDNEDGVGYIDYNEESGMIRADADELWMKYIRKVDDPNVMTPDFREVIAYKLAIEAAISIANSNTLSELMQQRFDRAWTKALSTDSLGDRPGQMPAGSWTTRRFGTARTTYRW